MLSLPYFHESPFPFFAVDNTFSEEHCAFLEALFSHKGDWQHRDGSFYQCSILDVTSQIPHGLQSEVLAKMREITELPLVDEMLVTAQRMRPGQAIGIHSDRPLLGYELVRLVVQLNKNWRTEHGGVLELFATPDGQSVVSVEPVYNKGFIFVLNEGSYHAVTEAVEARQSLVFNFWHAANTPVLEEHVKELFANIRFSELPTALEPIASAELDLTEETTFIAETAAVALTRWGCSEAIILLGYQYSAGLEIKEELDDEAFAAVRLAHWVATLYRESFNLKKWLALQRDLCDMSVSERLEKTWRLCLPEINYLSPNRN